MRNEKCRVNVSNKGVIDISRKTSLSHCHTLSMVSISIYDITSFVQYNRPSLPVVLQGLFWDLGFSPRLISNSVSKEYPKDHQLLRVRKKHINRFLSVKVLVNKAKMLVGSIAAFSKFCQNYRKIS